MKNNIELEFVLSPITHIHIGNGNQLSPTDYIIKKDTIYFINIVKYTSYLISKDKESFEKKLEKEDIFDIYDFFIDNFEIDKKNTYYTSYNVNNIFLKNFKTKLDKKTNQLLLNEFIRNGISFKPYIPGSSLKGSLRTAILNNMVTLDKFANLKNLLIILIKKQLKKIRIPKHIKYFSLDKVFNKSELKWFAEYLENILLGLSQPNVLEYINKNYNLIDNLYTWERKLKTGNCADKSPFKHLLIPDTHFSNNILDVFDAEFINKNGKKAPLNFHEVIAPKNKNNITITGKIIVKKEFLNLDIFSDITGTDSEIKHKLKKRFEKILKNYYNELYKDENEYLKNTLKLKLKPISDIQKNTFIKIGKGSGQNYLSFKFAQKVIADFTKENDLCDFYPSSRKTVNNMPMGWCMIEFK